MRYRRSNTKGATYFFTVNLADRSNQLLATHINALRAAVAHVKYRHPFKIDAWVVLPDHLHAIWTLPSAEAEFSKRWLLIKAGFSRCIERKEIIRASRLHKGERGILQRRFLHRHIRFGILSADGAAVAGPIFLMVKGLDNVGVRKLFQSTGLQNSRTKSKIRFN